MSTLTWNVWACGVVVAIAGLCGGTTPAALGEADEKADADDRVVHWLDQLEARGEELKTLTASISLETVDNFLDDRQVRLGTVWYVAPTEAEPLRFHVHFDQLVIDDALRRQDRRYIFDGRWFAEVDQASRTWHRRELVREGQQVDLLSIDGPFPLPLGQQRDEVLERFAVEVVDEEAGEEGNLVHLHLTPRTDVELGPGEADLDQVEMWFDRETLLPERVETTERHEQTVVALYDRKMNDPEVAEVNFSTEPPDDLGPGWNIEVTELDD